VRTFYAAGYVANVPIMVVPVSPHQDVVAVVELLCVLAKHWATPRSPRLASAATRSDFADHCLLPDSLFSRLVPEPVWLRDLRFIRVLSMILTSHDPRLPAGEHIPTSL
jgi:hypothetical protein